MDRGSWRATVHGTAKSQTRLVTNTLTFSGLPGGSVGKESACSAGDPGDVGSIPGSGRSRKPTPVILPEESHGLRSLV